MSIKQFSPFLNLLFNLCGQWSNENSLICTSVPSSHCLSFPIIGNYPFGNPPEQFHKECMAIKSQVFSEIWSREKTAGVYVHFFKPVFFINPIWIKTIGPIINSNSFNPFAAKQREYFCQLLHQQIDHINPWNTVYIHVSRIKPGINVS